MSGGSELLRARLLALIVAAAMVGGAILIRNAIDDDGGNRADDDDRIPVLLCATELAAACDELEESGDVKIVLESARTTAERLASLSDEDRRSEPYDGWLAFGRDLEIVREARQRGGLASVLEPPSDPIGRTPLVLAIWRDRANALQQDCGGEVTWRCIGDVAGTPWRTHGGEAAWGDVKPGHADPSLSGEGLAVIGQAAAQFFGRTNLSRDDFEDDAFLEWFTRLEGAVPTGGRTGDESPFVRMLTAGASVFDVVATTEAEAGPLLASASRDRRDRVRLLYPSPVATADVRFASFVDGNEDLFDLVTGDDARAALADAGYRVDDEDRAKGVPDTPPLPGRANLPDAGALEALLDTWREVTG
jgi:hypothetical protein